MAPSDQESSLFQPQPPPRPESLPQRASLVRRVPFPNLPISAGRVGQVADPLDVLKAALYPQLRMISSPKPFNPAENGFVILDNGEVVELKPARSLSKLQASQEVAQYYQKFAAILWHHIFDLQDEALAARYERQEALDDLALRQESLNFELDYAQAQVSKLKAEAAAWKMKYNLAPSRNQPPQLASHNPTAQSQGNAESSTTLTVMENTKFVTHASTTQAGHAIASSGASCAARPGNVATEEFKKNAPRNGILESPARKLVSWSYSPEPPRYHRTRPTAPAITKTSSPDEDVIAYPRREKPSFRIAKSVSTTVKDTQSTALKGKQDQITPHTEEQPHAQDGDTTETDSDLALERDGNNGDTDSDSPYISESESSPEYEPAPRKRARHGYARQLRRAVEDDEMGSEFEIEI